ncbi:helix-turn-helix domain-containing protein [Actinomadura atramentaria]|uniref:helix-turn-helix domain-containing protein n=1 Tax=Actinomadura atramentaria TaxID=1990 RepID=UPI0003672A66|nr:helix-turn-helix transcriptional regulator [Actinomadura atramentaria]
MLLREALGRVLRKLRRTRGLSLREVSELARVSLPYLSEVERGRKEISSELLATICRALGITLEQLLIEVSTEILRHRPAPTPRTIHLTTQQTYQLAA